MIMTDNKIKVCVYTGSFNLIKKSGVGKAIEHQITVLKNAGFSVNEEPLRNCDIIHINFILPDSVFKALHARKLGVKVVFYGHSTMEDFKNSFAGSNFFAPLFKRWIIFCYNLGDIIITPSEYSKKILEGYGLKKEIYALSNGINTDFWKKDPDHIEASKEEFIKKYNIPRDSKIIISVGHFMRRKGIDDFISLAQSNPDKTFIWFGHTDAILVPSDIRRKIRNAPSNLIFAGYVESEDLKKAYECSDLFLFLSREETEGIVVLEALSCGIPTIVRDIPVYEGWLSDNENVYKFKGKKQLDELLSNVLSNDNFSVIKMGRLTAESRNFSNIGKELSSIYSRLL